MWRRWRWAAALLVLPFSFHAQGAEFQGSAGVSSDDVFRGLSLTYGNPSFFADVHGVGTHWLGGVTAQTVRLVARDSTQTQLVADLGYVQPINTDWTTQLNARHYDYPGAPYRSRYDYDELSAELSFQGRASLTIIGSPNDYAFSDRQHYGRGAAIAAELAGEVPLNNGFAAQLGLGYQDLQQQVGAGYAYWSAGIMWRWHALALSGAYIGTDGTAQRLFGTRAGNRAVASIVWLF